MTKLNSMNNGQDFKFQGMLDQKISFIIKITNSRNLKKDLLNFIKIMKLHKSFYEEKETNDLIG